MESNNFWEGILQEKQSLEKQLFECKQAVKLLTAEKERSNEQMLLWKSKYDAIIREKLKIEEQLDFHKKLCLDEFTEEYNRLKASFAMITEFQRSISESGIQALSASNLWKSNQKDDVSTSSISRSLETETSSDTKPKT